MYGLLFKLLVVLWFINFVLALWSGLADWLFYGGYKLYSLKILRALFDYLGFRNFYTALEIAFVKESLNDESVFIFSF